MFYFINVVTNKYHIKQTKEFNVLSYEFNWHSLNLTGNRLSEMYVLFCMIIKKV